MREKTEVVPSPSRAAMTAAPAGVVSLMIMNIIEYLPHLPHLPSRDELENWGPVGKVAWKNSWFQVDRLLIDLTVLHLFWRPSSS